jgi:hypothetical protein
MQQYRTVSRPIICFSEIKAIDIFMDVPANSVQPAIFFKERLNITYNTLQLKKIWDPGIMKS